MSARLARALAMYLRPDTRAASCAASARPVTVLVGDTRSSKLLTRIKTNGWGRMFCAGNATPFEGERWGFDNGAYVAWTKGQRFDDAGFLRRVERAYRVGTPLLAVLPDAVGGGLGSIKMSLRWLNSGKLPSDWPWYVALQDGCMGQEVVAELTGETRPLFVKDFQEWRGRTQGIAGLFLGGTDRFKFTAPYWRRLADHIGMKFHYGRAGTPSKLRHALGSKCDSLDSAFPLWSMERFDAFEAAVMLPDPQGRLL